MIDDDEFEGIGASLDGTVMSVKDQLVKARAACKRLREERDLERLERSKLAAETVKLTIDLGKAISDCASLRKRVSTLEAAWERVAALEAALRPFALSTAPAPAMGLAAVVGKWPGVETEAELLAVIEAGERGRAEAEKGAGR